MDKHCLFKRVKDEYKDSFIDHIKKFKSSGELLESELKENRYVSKLTYSTIIHLQDATGFYGSPFEIFKEIENDL